MHRSLEIIHLLEKVRWNSTKIILVFQLAVKQQNALWLILLDFLYQD